MVDQITNFATNSDIVSLTFILAINMIFVFYYLKKGKQVPTYIFLMNFLFTLGVFVDGAGLSISYAYLIMLSSAGIMAYTYQKVFAEGVAQKQKILLIYTAFFVTMLFIQSTALLGGNLLTGSIPNLKPVDNCGGFGIFLCAYNTAINMLSLFNISSSIGVLNTLLIAPYLVFIGIYVIEIIRG